MTGVLNAMVGGGEQLVLIDVTMGTDGTTRFGYADSGSGISGAPFGSASTTAFRGKTIEILMSSGAAGNNLALRFDSAVSDSAFFKRVLVQATSGSQRTFLIGDATFITDTYTWGNGSDPAWSATSPSPRRVIIYY
jgi:hypothetical protein